MECCTECCRGRTTQFEVLRSERESSQGPRADVPLPPLFFWSATQVSPVPRGLLSASHFHENAVLPGYSSRLFVSWHHSVLLPYLLTMPSQSCYGLFVLGLHLNISRVCPSAFFFVVSRWSCSFSWLQLLYGNISQFPSVIFNIKTPVNSRLIHNCLLDISPEHCIASQHSACPQPNLSVSIINSPVQPKTKDKQKTLLFLYFSFRLVTPARY